MRSLSFLVLFLGAVQAAVGPADIIATLESFAADATSLQKSAGQVNLINAQLVALKQGPLWVRTSHTLMRTSIPHGNRERARDESFLTIMTQADSHHRPASVVSMQQPTKAPK